MGSMVNCATFLAAALLVLSGLPLIHGAKYYSIASLYIQQSSTNVPYSMHACGMLAVGGSKTTVAYDVILSSVSYDKGYSVYMRLASEQGMMAMHGPAGTGLMYNIFPSLEPTFANVLPVFGPLAQSVSSSKDTNFMTYASEVYWTMPSEQAQAVGLLVLLAKRDLFPVEHLLEGSVEITTGISAGIILSTLQSLYGYFLHQRFSTSTYSQIFYELSIAVKPRIVFHFVQAESFLPNGNEYSERWSSNLVSDPTLIELNSTIATTFEMHYQILQAYNSQKASGAAMLPPENFVTSAPVPGVDATEYVAVADFVNQASSRFTPGMSQSLKNFMMAGWVSGTALMQALNKYTGPALGSSTVFFHALLVAQSSFVVSDLFIGTFASGSPLCNRRQPAGRQGILCGCHHGGNNIWFHTFVKSGATYDTAAMRGELYQYALGNCANLIPPGDVIANVTPYEDLISTPVPIHVAGFAPTDNTMMETVCTQTHDVITRLSNTNLYQHTSTHTYRGYCIPSAVNTVSTALATHTSTFVMTSMMGVMPDTVTTPTTLVLDYIPQTTQPHVSQANLVYLFPTLEQDLYVLASYLGGIVTDASVVCAAVSSSTVSGSIVTLLTTTLATFGISLTDDHVAQPTSGLGANIPAGCSYTFAIGMGEDDAAGLLSYLQTNANSYLLVPFDDLTKYYTSLSASLGSAGAAVTNRFLFATNIPLWTSVASNPTAAAASAPLSTVSQFLQSVPVGLQTPAAVRAYFVAMLYDQLSAGEEPQTGDMQQRLYDSVSVTVSGVEFGPFSTQCIMETIASTETTCLYNYGARGISVWSYTSVADPSIAAVQDAVTPSMAHAVHSEAAGVVHSVVDKGCVQVPSWEDVVVNPTSGWSMASATGSSDMVRSPSQEDGKVTLLLSVVQRSWSRRSGVRTLSLAVLACLCVAIVMVVVLLLLKCGLLRLCVAPLRCKSVRAAVDIAGVLSARHKHHKESLALQRAAQDVSRAPSVDATQPLTVVCVDVAHFRALWTTAPDVMSCAVADYQRCVRQSILRHGCYEVNTVDGLFVIACYSADAGVSVALDCAAAARSLDAKSSAAVNAAYAACCCGCDVPAGCGLRLRIAVHCGTVAERDSATADVRVRFRGGAVDDAVCAACCSRSAWEVVVTESARRGLADAEALCLEPLGPATLLHSGATELFAVRKGMLSVTAVVPIVAGSHIHVRYALAAGVNRPDAIASGLCRRYLETFLANFCEKDSSAYVTAVAACLGLSALSRDDYEDEDAYFAALLRAVCGRLGALLECRHGVVSGSAFRNQGSMVSWNASVETCADCWDAADASFAGSFRYRRQSGSRKVHSGLRDARVALRNMAYSRNESAED